MIQRHWREFWCWVLDHAWDAPTFGPQKRASVEQCDRCFLVRIKTR